MDPAEPPSLRTRLLTAFATLIGVCVLYVLSVGPYAYVGERTDLHIPLDLKYYRHLFWLTAGTPLDAPLERYVDWWILKAWDHGDAR